MNVKEIEWMNEADAIILMKAGNIAGLKALIEVHQVQAVQAAVFITRDRPMAEDIVQNAFLRSFERIAQFDHSRPFGPWFLRMVINDAIKAASKHKRQVSLDTDEEEIYQQLINQLAVTSVEPEDLIQRKDLRQAINDAIGRLSSRQRAVIVQRYYLGLSEREMADELDCAPGTVKWYLNSARKRLKALLQPFIE
jgi:RNA polymerase sigma-70 factor (ECF subfamily)